MQILFSLSEVLIDLAIDLAHMKNEVLFSVNMLKKKR